MAQSNFENLKSDLTAPIRTAVEITPSDSADLATTPTRAIFVGVGGDVTVDMATTGTAVTFKNVPSGTLLPIQVNRIDATGTDATDIVALY